MADVFVSYHHGDLDVAEKVCDHLVSEGRSVFLDKRRLRPGSRWEPMLRAELEAARSVVVLWTGAAARSEWVRREAASGFERKRLVQVLVGPAEIPKPFKSHQALDLTRWEPDPASALVALSSAVEEVLRLPPDAPQVVHDELSELVRRLDGTTPEKSVGENLLLGTWNLRQFSILTEKWTAGPHDSPKRDLRSIVAVAEIMRRLDVVILQEVKPGIAFDFLMESLGPEWASLTLAPRPGLSGNDERTVFLYDNRRVVPDGLADRVVFPPEWASVPLDDAWQLFYDQPYAASFRTRFGDPPAVVSLLTVRLMFGIRDQPLLDALVAVSDYVGGWAESERANGANLLLVGDLGPDRRGDPVYDSFVHDSIELPNGIRSAPRSVFSGRPGHGFVDHIGWVVDDNGEPVMAMTYEGMAGYMDFVGAVHAQMSRQELSWRLSDHYPLWVELRH